MEDDFDLSKLLKTKKKRKNSKVKGNTFERKVCDILNERFNTTEFCRTPGSGAFATTHSLPEHLKIYGDVVTPKNFKFVIECKKGYNKENLCSLFNPNSILIGMIAQSARDSEKSKRKSFIVLSQDRKDPIVIVNQNGFTHSIEAVRNASTNIGLVVGTKFYYILTLKDFLALPDDFFLEIY